jgi:hypothetical protein
MRMNMRHEAVMSLAILSTLLLAGFGCGPALEQAKNGTGFGGPSDNQDADQPQTENDAAVDANPIAPDAEQPPAITWIIGNPEGSFVHVQPGVKSEIYIDLQTGPGRRDRANMDPNEPVPVVSIGMKGPGVMGAPVETKPFQPNGKMHFIFPINRFGDYTATGDVMENGHSVFHFVVPEHVK